MAPNCHRHNLWIDRLHALLGRVDVKVLQVSWKTEANQLQISRKSDSNGAGRMLDVYIAALHIHPGSDRYVATRLRSHQGFAPIPVLQDACPRSCSVKTAELSQSDRSPAAKLR